MSKPLRVAALVDLPLTPISGGHARGWEKIARVAAATDDLPLDLSVYFSGDGPAETLAPHVRIRHLPPVFSTRRLKFLPYVPDHTDLAKYHPALARELGSFDVIHTTDAFFAFARTAERIGRKKNIPLVTSFHTDTPAYANVFTRRTIETLFGKGRISHWLTDTLKYPARQEAIMHRRLCAHVSACSAAIATRQIDIDLAAGFLGKDNVFLLRTAADKDTFGPHRRDRAGLEAAYGIPPDRTICLFVGRVDEGKNIFTLLEAMETLVHEGLNLHLITAGVGPAENDLMARLGSRVTTAGFVQPEDLGRLYASVDIMTAPSNVEVRSLVAIEAMLSGLPVLLSAQSGVAKHYGDPEAMVNIGPHAADWAGAIRTLTYDSNRRRELSKAALDFAAGVPSWHDLLAEDILPVWQRAARKKET